ncbi:MAG: hypothetical protein ACI4QJ_04160 [Candidatus Spyradenecus sp.]
MLTYAWRAEATRPAEVAVTIRQGETLRLACTLLERSKPIAVPDDATSRFFWRDADAKGNYWAKEATRQGSELAFVWTAACDVGAKRYDFVLSLESPTAGTLYRASGLLIMQSSPGFNPASLQPPDVFAEIVAATQAAILEVAATKGDLQAEADARAEADSALQGALSAEAAAREESDGAITEAVNAQAGVLEQHQGYLAALSGNFNNLFNSYTNTVSELQATDAAHASALAAKADAAALTNHAATWATGTVGGHVKLGTNSILSTADGNFGVVGKTSNNQLIYRLDATPTENSNLPVKSGGVYTALATKAALEHTHSQYLTTESDPTVSAWAKAATKPTYTWTEILNRPTTWDWANLTSVPTAFPPAEHTHSQYLTTESDPTISAWAKAATKPTYTAAEVGAQPAGKYVTYDTTSHSLDAVSKETSFAGGLRTDSFKTLYGTPFFNTVSDYGFNITGFYRLNGYLTENNPLLEWDVSTQKSKLAVTTVYEGGTSLSNKYAPISHEHTVSAITDFPATWDWAKLTNKPTTFTPAEHNHDGTYLKLTGGTVTGNVTFSGASNYMEKLEFGGSAGAAGLMTRGISGRTYSNSPGGAKDSLFLNYDGSTIPHSTYWNYGNDNARGVFVCGGAPDGLVVRRIDLETILKDYSAKAHTHAINEVTNLQVALDGKADAAHTHAIADTTGLQAALDALAPLSSVTCTTNNVTYIWQWDDDAGTFALRASE